tara:strand:- start:318 stop:602 length:285 start_codon:yes stop_codon:yes gene_type:complete
MNNETNNTATPRTKSQLRYAIKTKVFSDTETTLAATLNVASNWVTFNKTSWLYKHNGYVAGADFDTEARDFNYYLKTDGTIIRRGGHTNWQRVH